MNEETKENHFFVDSEKLSEKALAKKHQLETDPSCRRDPMEYFPEMEQISSDVRDKVVAQMESYDYTRYTAADVRRALNHETCGVEDFKALLSPAAEPFLEEMAQRARWETGRHFGNTVYLFTPLYIANYCENYCVYCGFNCYNDIQRLQLNAEQIEHEMKVIADSGMEEILILTGESKTKSSVEYIGDACRMARKYFKNVGLEIYPVNTEEYRYLHECGADYVTVFQETYDLKKYETLHLMGHKRVWPYRFEAQERALMGGMRGVGFSALLGLSDFRRDALATALHIWYLQRKYPQAEFSLSCPRLRPIINNEKSIRSMWERRSCVRFSVHIGFFFRMPALRYLHGKARRSAMALHESVRRRYPPECRQELAIMRKNTRDGKKRRRATHSLRFAIRAASARCMRI